MLGNLFGKKKPELVSRDGERYEVTWRVLSRDLPGYRGVTLDLSRSGVQLETSGLLEVGSCPELKFEFDRGELESFTCKGRVVWSRQGSSDRVFHSGLHFEPETDDEIRQLSRMATVLQTRSETDLKTLLDQARRLDPDLENNYRNISNIDRYRPTPQEEAAAQANASPQASPPPPPPTPQAPPPPPQAPKKQVPPNLGIYIPLAVTLEGYMWNCSTRTLHLGLKEGDASHSLYFPNCQLFQVLEPAADKLIEGLYSTFTSPATRKLQLGGDKESFKHYRFVGPGGKGLIDIVSGPVQSQP